MTKHVSSFLLKALPVAVAMTTVSAYGAGLDRSGQDITAFLQDGTYAEAVYTYIDADVSGHDNGVARGASLAADYVKGRATGDIAESYDFFRYGVKTDASDRLSVGVLYDEPFGASVTYTGNSNFTGTNVEIRTNNVTALAGYKLGANNGFMVYGGPAAQRLDGEVYLRGIAYQGAMGYDARISPDTQVGWVAGVAFAKPEIALKAALTYRSEIEHSTQIAEIFPALGAAGTTHRDFKVTLPESYNLDFQTGINPSTLLTAKVRYVPWSDFDIRPPTYGAATALVNNGVPLPIVSYSKDQWQAELGLGRKLSDRLAVSGSVGYDSGAGNPATSLGPIKGYYSVGLGAKYNLTPAWSVSLGGKYLKFGDATANLPSGHTVGKFDDNDGYAVGLKVAYHAK